MARPDAAQPSRRVGATKLRHGRGSGANARVEGAVAGPAPIAVRRNRRRGSRRGSIPRVRSSAALGAHPARGAATAERTGRAVLVRVANLLEGDDAAAVETRHVDVAETASVPAGTARASALSPRRGGVDGGAEGRACDRGRAPDRRRRTRGGTRGARSPPPPPPRRRDARSAARRSPGRTGPRAANAPYPPSASMPSEGGIGYPPGNGSCESARVASHQRPSDAAAAPPKSRCCCARLSGTPKSPGGPRGGSWWK